MKKIICAILALSICLLCGCSAKSNDTKVELKDFRVTAYYVAREGATVDKGNLDTVTDMIFFGVANFGEDGKVVLDKNFDTYYDYFKKQIEGKDIKVYLNLLGPSEQGEFDDWNKQMADKAQRHTNAFNSGILVDEINKVVDKYNFDGVCFDYEYPIKHKYWKPFNNFLVDLKSKMNNKKLVIALADWDIKLSKKAIDAVDMIEVMSYDLWDDDGNHATYDIYVKSAEKFVKKGIDKSKLDLGLPFYARPTDGGEYWGSYNEYVGKINDKGLVKDDKLKLTYSFNTPEVITKKTDYAIDNGFGGVMIWNYGCDTDYSNKLSLFKAINTSVENHE